MRRSRRPSPSATTSTGCRSIRGEYPRDPARACDALGRAAHDGAHAQRAASAPRALREVCRGTTSQARARIDERMPRQGASLKRRLARARAREPAVARGHRARTSTTSTAVPATPASFDALHELIEQQAYRLRLLARRAGRDQLPALLRHQRARRAAPGERRRCSRRRTGWLFELVRRGRGRRLRIDHPDGLYDPTRSTSRRAMRRGAAERAADVRGGREDPRAARAPAGGLARARHDRLPLHQRGQRAVRRRCRRGAARPRLCERSSATTIAFDERRCASQDADRCARAGERAQRCSPAASRASRAPTATPATSRSTACATRWPRSIACFPGVSHLRRPTTCVAGRPALHRLGGRRRARRQPRRGHRRVRFPARCARPASSPRRTPNRAAAVRAFARKFQQFTAPVMAKGVEDTAFYLYNRLASLNDVGGDPSDSASRRRAFHRASSQPRPPLAAHDARHLDARQQALRGRACAHRRALRAAGGRGACAAPLAAAQPGPQARGRRRRRRPRATTSTCCTRRCSAAGRAGPVDARARWATIASASSPTCSRRRAKPRCTRAGSTSTRPTSSATEAFVDAPARRAPRQRVPRRPARGGGADRVDRLPQQPVDGGGEAHLARRARHLPGQRAVGLLAGRSRQPAAGRLRTAPGHARRARGAARAARRGAGRHARQPRGWTREVLCAVAPAATARSARGALPARGIHAGARERGPGATPGRLLRAGTAAKRSSRWPRGSSPGWACGRARLPAGPGCGARPASSCRCWRRAPCCARS